MPNIKQRRKNDSSEKTWSLIVLIIGVLLGFGITQLDKYLELKTNKTTFNKIIKSDIINSIERIDKIITVFENIKIGKYPNLIPKSESLDSSLYKVAVSLPTHVSFASEIIKSNLSLASEYTLTNIIRFYDELAYCDQRRNECEQVSRTQSGVEPVNIAPVCDVYLDVLKNTRDNGKRLLEKLELE